MTAAIAMLAFGLIEALIARNTLRILRERTISGRPRHVLCRPSLRRRGRYRLVLRHRSHAPRRLRRDSP